MSSHFFTLEEANTLIPTLEEKLSCIQGHWRRLKKLGPAQDSKEQSRLISTDRAVAPFYFEVLERFQQSIEEIHALGCELKGIEPGLVDFRTLIKGKEVYLCWKQGEKEITYWHPLHTGYAGRQALRENPSSST